MNAHKQPQQAPTQTKNENDNLFIDWIIGTKAIDNDFIDIVDDYGKQLVNWKEKKKDFKTGEYKKNAKTGEYEYTDESLSTSKLRKFFGKLRKIEAEGLDMTNKVPLILLRAQLAYDAKRDGKAATLDFQKKIDDCLKTVCDAKNKEDYDKYFKRFMHVLEAIVAYHKFHGGDS